MVTTVTTALSNISQLDFNGYYTYQDYLTWTFPERVELYRGTPHLLSPAPNRRHQTIAKQLVGPMYFYFNDSDCELFFAPFDVRLPISRKEGREDTVVQPDICVICDKSKLEKQGCNGAPDLVVEIISHGNSAREMREKYALYEASGVREYWLVLPGTKLVVVYTLNEDGTYVGHQPRTSEESITSIIFPDLSIDLGKVFAYEGDD